MELLKPLPKGTAERYSDIWMDEVDTRNFCLAFREMDEEKFIARLRRQATIDKLLKDATNKRDP